MIGTEIALLQQLIDELDPPDGESVEFYIEAEKNAAKLIQLNPQLLGQQAGPEDNNVTPLIAAVMNKERCCSLDLFKKLVQPPTNVDAAKEFGLRAIHFLACYNRHEHLQVLINLFNENKIKVDVNAKTAVGDTAVNLAALQGANEALALLTIVGKADVNIVNEQKQSPLHVACLFGQPQGGKRETPITDAEAQKYLECIELLVLAGAKVNALEEFGSTPAHCLVSVDIPEDIKLSALNTLIEHGADLTLKAKNLNTAVAMAKAYEFHEFSEKLQKQVVPSLKLLAARKLIEDKVEETSLIDDIANILKKLRLGKGTTK